MIEKYRNNLHISRGRVLYNLIALSVWFENAFNTSTEGTKFKRWKPETRSARFRGRTFPITHKCLMDSHIPTSMSSSRKPEIEQFFTIVAKSAASIRGKECVTVSATCCQTESVDATLDRDKETTWDTTSLDFLYWEKGDFFTSDKVTDGSSASDTESRIFGTLRNVRVRIID